MYDVGSIIEIKNTLKEIGAYDADYFEEWYSAPIPDFEYKSPKDMFDSGDLTQLQNVMKWLDTGMHSRKNDSE